MSFARENPLTPGALSYFFYAPNAKSYRPIKVMHSQVIYRHICRIVISLPSFPFCCCLWTRNIRFRRVKNVEWKTNRARLRLNGLLPWPLNSSYICGHIELCCAPLDVFDQLWVGAEAICNGLQKAVKHVLASTVWKQVGHVSIQPWRKKRARPRRRRRDVCSCKC